MRYLLLFEDAQLKWEKEPIFSESLHCLKSPWQRQGYSNPQEERFLTKMRGFNISGEDRLIVNTSGYFQDHKQLNET